MIKKFLLGLIGLFLVYLLVVWSGVLPRNTATQAQALAVLKEPYQYAKGKQNGFQHLWLVPYDIPQNEIAAAYAKELQDYRTAVAAGTPQKFVSHLEKKYSRQSLPENRLCPRAPESCLAFVRKNYDQARKTALDFSAYRIRGEKLRGADHIANDLDFSYYTPLPPMQGINAIQTLTAAVDFTDGKTDVALDAVCQNLGTWRRLRSHADFLIVDMVGVAYSRDQINLLADMLAELPVDHVLPSSCSSALAPLAANEFDQCDIARGEMKVMSGYIEFAKKNGISTIEFGSSGYVDGIFSKLINARYAEARMAPHLAGFCDGQPAPPVEYKSSLTEKIFDPVGSYYAEMAAPNYSEYRARARDFSAMLQTMRTIIWLRNQPDMENAGDDQPADLVMQDHKLMLDKASKTLSIELLAPRPNDPKKWSLPLPASRLPTAGSLVSGASTTRVFTQPES
jgi:hypothetical protein